MDLISAYETLGIPIGAEAAVVRAAYRRLIAYYHPDRNKSQEALPTTQALNRAFQVIDEAGYPDHLNHDDTAGSSQAGSGAASGREDDPFARYYEDFRRYGSGYQQAAARRGKSIHRKVKVTLEEAAFGTVVSLSGKVKDNCGVCEGRRFVREEQCKTCHGEGRVYVRERGRGYYGSYGLHRERCDACGGSGVVRIMCGTCHGTGNTPVSREYSRKIRIPPGVVHDDELVIRGAGGRSTAEAGDFNIRIAVAPHEVFRFDPADGILTVHIPIDVLQFMAGEPVIVPTLWGDRTIMPLAPARIVEIAEAGFPGRHGERFPLRVYLDVREPVFKEPYLGQLREFSRRIHRAGLPQDELTEAYRSRLQAWHKRTGRA